jgi:hypothetical protein
MSIFNNGKLIVSGLFGTKRDVSTDNTLEQQTQPIQEKEGLSWKQKGFIKAGQSQGSVATFHAGFMGAYAEIKKKQEDDEALQQRLKEEVLANIAVKNSNKNNKANQLQTENAKLGDIDEQIKEKQAEKDRIMKETKTGSKSIKLNLWIGAIVLVFLSVYLFIFYSSTVYSAFFRDWKLDILDDGTVETAKALFDGNSIPKAFAEKGIGAGLLVLLMPFVFMALGLVAHNMKDSGKNFTTYAKIVLMYLVTFIADALFAYLIAKRSFDAEHTLDMGEKIDYNPGMAFADETFWMVIMCGFAAYLIWGLLFGFVMDCYGKLTSNSYLLENIDRVLQQLTNSKQNQRQAITNLKNEINNIEAEITKLNTKLNSHVRYSFDEIRSALHDYYNGWTTYYGTLKRDVTPLRADFERSITEVETWMAK